MGYYNIVEVEAATANLATAYPTFTTLIPLPKLSADGNRTSHALHISLPSQQPKPVLMILAGVHACEWGSCEIALNLAADLLAVAGQPAALSYGSKHFAWVDLKALLDAIDIVLFPLVNPDGRLFSQTDPIQPMWRKNRNAQRARGNPDAVGVDLNRNFDFLFDLSEFAPGSGVSSRKEPTHLNYQGPWAFSEPETQNVRFLLDNFPRTRWFVDLHSCSQEIRYVWGDDDTQTGDPRMNFMNPTYRGKRGLRNAGYGEYMPPADLAMLQSLAARFVADVGAVRGTTYTPGASFQVNPFSGTSHDYVYARHFVDPNKGKVLPFYVEWGATWQPAWAEMEEIVKEVTAGLIGFSMKAAGVGPP